MENSRLSGLKKYIRYTMQLHPGLVWGGAASVVMMIICNHLFVSGELLTGMIVGGFFRRMFEVIALACIDTSVLSFVTPFTVSLPFSREELWKDHFYCQTILLGGFTMIFAFCIRRSYLELLITVSMVLIVYFLEPMLMLNRMIAIPIVSVITFVINLIPIFAIDEWESRVGAISFGVKLAVLGIVVIVGIICSLLNWRYCEKSLFSRKGMKE